MTEPEEPTAEWLDELKHTPADKARGALSEEAKRGERITESRSVERARLRKERRQEALAWIGLVLFAALLLWAIWVTR